MTEHAVLRCAGGHQEDWLCALPAAALAGRHPESPLLPLLAMTAAATQCSVQRSEQRASCLSAATNSFQGCRSLERQHHSTLFVRKSMTIVCSSSLHVYKDPLCCKRSRLLHLQGLWPR
jgi:hypothetical protein